MSEAGSISLRAQGSGVLVKVTARPGTGDDRVMGVHGDALKLGVSAPPDKGKANKALAILLAETLGVPRSSVEIVSGETSREKQFLVAGVDLARVRSALEAALG